MTDVELWTEDVGEVSPVGRIPRWGLSFDDWASTMQGFFEVQRSLNWLIGDGLNYGESKYGEAYAQAVEVTGWDYQRLADAKWVAGAVPIDVRRLDLSWTHHKYVASLEVDAQIRWLDLAEENSWSSAELKRAMNGQLLEDGSEIVLPVRSRTKRKLLGEIFMLYETSAGILNGSTSEWVGKLSREEKEAVLEINDMAKGLAKYCEALVGKL